MIDFTSASMDLPRQAGDFWLAVDSSEDFGNINFIAPMATGDLFVGGNFQSINGFPRIGLALLHGDDSSTPLTQFLIEQAAFNGNGRFEMKLGGRPGAAYRLQRSEALAIWANLHDYTAGQTAKTYEDPGSGAGGHRVYRVIPRP